MRKFVNICSLLIAIFEFLLVLLYSYFSWNKSKLTNLIYRVGTGCLLSMHETTNERLHLLVAKTTCYQHMGIISELQSTLL